LNVKKKKKLKYSVKLFPEDRVPVSSEGMTRGKGESFNCTRWKTLRPEKDLRNIQESRAGKTQEGNVPVTSKGSQ